MTRKSSTDTLIAAMRILARDIQSGDGVANVAIAEAADRLAEQQVRIAELEKRTNTLLEQRNRMGQDVQNAAITGTIPPNHPFAAQLGLVTNLRAKVAELEQANSRVILGSSVPEPATVAVDSGALEALRSAMSKLRAAMSRTEYAAARAGIIEAAYRLLAGG